MQKVEVLIIIQINGVTVYKTYENWRTFSYTPVSGEVWSVQYPVSVKFVGSAVYYVIIFLNFKSIIHIFYTKAFKCGVAPCSFEMKIWYLAIGLYRSIILSLIELALTPRIIGSFEKVTFVQYVQNVCVARLVPLTKSLEVWESPRTKVTIRGIHKLSLKWAVHPNKRYGFRGCKTTLNHAHALVSACP